MKKCTEYKIGITRIEKIPDYDDYYLAEDFLGKYTNDIGPGVYVRTAGDFYERLSAEMERDESGRFIGKGEPEYSTYSREYNGIIPVNHIPHNLKNWSHVSRKAKSECIKKYGSLKNTDYHYAIEDCRRLEALGTDWHYVTVRVETRISTNTGLSDIVYNTLSGIESDSGDDYFEEVARDLIGMNIAELEKMGFSMDEIKKSTDNPEYHKEW